MNEERELEYLETIRDLSAAYKTARTELTELLEKHIALQNDYLELGRKYSNLLDEKS